MAKPYDVMALMFKESTAHFDAEIEVAERIWQNVSTVPREIMAELIGQ